MTGIHSAIRQSNPSVWDTPLAASSLRAAASAAAPSVSPAATFAGIPLAIGPAGDSESRTLSALDAATAESTAAAAMRSTSTPTTIHTTRRRRGRLDSGWTASARKLARVWCEEDITAIQAQLTVHKPNPRQRRQLCFRFSANR